MLIQQRKKNTVKQMAIKEVKNLYNMLPKLYNFSNKYSFMEIAYE